MKERILSIGILILLFSLNVDAGYCSGSGCAGYLSATTCEAAEDCDWEFVCGDLVPCYCGDTVIADYTLTSDLKNSDGSHPCSDGIMIPKFPTQKLKETCCKALPLNFCSFSVLNFHIH